MSKPKNLQWVIQQLTTHLETQRELGLLPEYVWLRNSTQNSLRMGGLTGGGPPPNRSSAKAERESPGDTVKTGPIRQSCLQQLREKIGDCTRCRLHQGRTHLVFGVGNPEAELMFVGEGPGRDEDLQGEPFVGRAGQLLTKIIEAMGLKRSEVYIANVIKCRPPENRNPAPDEITTCSPFLFEQIEIIHPKVIVCLGNFALQTLLATEQKISSLRGHLHRWPSAILQQILKTHIPVESIQLMPTYHPAFLLRNPNMKKCVWDDMKIVMQALGYLLHTSP